MLQSLRRRARRRRSSAGSRRRAGPLSRPVSRGLERGRPEPVPDGPHRRRAGAPGGLASNTMSRGVRHNNITNCRARRAAALTVVIRAARLPDAPWLAGARGAHVSRDLCPAQHPGEHGAVTPPTTRGWERQKAELRDGRMITLVAEADGDPAGYVQLFARPRACGRGECRAHGGRALLRRPPLARTRGFAQELMERRWTPPGWWGPDAVAGRVGAGSASDRLLPQVRLLRMPGTQTFVLGVDHQRDLVLARSLE